jgi:hypothetical protein
MSTSEYYHCFISFKKTDAMGAMTEDARIARHVYEYLTEKGMRVFFSEVTLASLGEANYTRAIEKALDSTNIMIVVGTSKENLESEWVSHEWSTFANIIRSGKRKGQIVSYCSGMPHSELPVGLLNFQAYHHSPDADESLETLHNFVSNAYKRMVAAGEISPTPPAVPRLMEERVRNNAATADRETTPKRKSRTWPVLLVLLLLGTLVFAGYKYYRSMPVDIDALTESAVIDLLDAQIDAWNDRDADAYLACYDSLFVGQIFPHSGAARKFSLKKWMDDFSSAGRDLHPATVEAGAYAITIDDTENGSARVPLTFTSEEFTEAGEAVLKIRLVRGAPKIASEIYTARERTVVAQDTAEAIVWEMLDPSARPLTDEEIETLPQDKLRALRGYIFARHGFIFEDEEMRALFSTFDWYQPTRENVDDYLSQIEQDNIDLIEDYLD